MIDIDREGIENSPMQSFCYPGLAGKVAVVTGGSRGIGAATCRLLAANGVMVVVNGRDEAAIASVVASIRSRGGQAIGVPADCTDFDALEALRHKVEQTFGVVDLLFAFAGGQGAPMPTEKIPEDLWRKVIDVNLTATFLTIKSFLPGMIERRRGVITTMASSAGRQPGMALAAYAAAKVGVVMLSRHLANEVGKDGIRVNCLAPSAIRTERLNERVPAEQQQQMAALFPLGRLGEPDDVAQAALFLASENASWLTGVTLDISGGRIIA